MSQSTVPPTLHLDLAAADAAFGAMLVVDAEEHWWPQCRRARYARVLVNLGLRVPPDPAWTAAHPDPRAQHMKLFAELEDLVGTALQALDDIRALDRGDPTTLAEHGLGPCSEPGGINRLRGAPAADIADRVDQLRRELWDTLNRLRWADDRPALAATDTREARAAGSPRLSGSTSAAS